jgi:hypothetical protein
METSDALENLLIKIGEILVERRKKPTEQVPEEEPTARERFVEMYTSEKDNVEPLNPKYQQENISNPLKYVVIKPKVNDKAVLQQMEEISRDKEESEKEKEEMEKERLHIQSQQQQVRSAFDEARRKQII